MKPEKERLDIIQGSCAGCSVPYMSDCPGAVEGGNISIIPENFAEQPKPAMAGKLAIVIDHNACAFLPPMLQRMESEIRQPCCVVVPPHAEKPALLVEAFKFCRHMSCLSFFCLYCACISWYPPRLSGGSSVVHAA